MKRVDCIKALARFVDKPLVVTTAGGATHEWWHFGDNRGHIPARTLGLCSSIGLGLALALPERRVIVLDGDGGLLMNLNTLVTTAVHRPRNLLHICFDNQVYESSGGTSTFTETGVDLRRLAEAAGIRHAYEARTVDEFAHVTQSALERWEHAFILARVEPGLADIPPIPIDEVESKYRLARHIEESEGRMVLRGPTSPVARQSTK